MSRRTKFTYASPEDPLAKQFLIRSLEHLTGRRRLERICDAVLNAQPGHQQLWANVLQELGVALAYDAGQLAKVPATGPVILIANHPYGVIDGLSICHFASLIRPDFRILINAALCQEPRVARYFLPIDFSETEAATLTNIAAKQQAMATLQAGNAVVIFPAGGIATTVRGPFGTAVDLEWKLFVTKLIQVTEATVLPIYFHGQNSRIFQLASHMSLTLRLALIIHEVNRKAGHTLRATIGDPIPYQQMAGIRKRKALLQHLRASIYALAERPVQHETPPRLPFEQKKPKREKQPDQGGY